MKNIGVVKELMERDTGKDMELWATFHVLQIMTVLAEEIDDELLREKVKQKLSDACVEWGEQEVKGRT